MNLVLTCNLWVVTYQLSSKLQQAEYVWAEKMTPLTGSSTEVEQGALQARAVEHSMTIKIETPTAVNVGDVVRMAIDSTEQTNGIQGGSIQPSYCLIHCPDAQPPAD
jgi:hypothetical protein